MSKPHGNTGKRNRATPISKRKAVKRYAFYVPVDQAEWIEFRRAQEGLTVSEYFRSMIDKARSTD